MTTLKTVQKFFPNVTSIIDASRIAMVEVTERDSSSKAVKQHTACAMAVACKRKFNLDGVIISRSLAYLIKGKQARRFLLPESVKREIISFDRGSTFEPGLYELAVVSESLRMDAKKRPTNRDRGKRGTKPKRFRHLTKNVRQVLGGQKPDA